MQLVLTDAGLYWVGTGGTIGVSHIDSFIYSMAKVQPYLNDHVTILEERMGMFYHETDSAVS